MNILTGKTGPTDIMEDDPFSMHNEPNWGWYTRRKMRHARQKQEEIRVGEAYSDLKVREAELSTMETEEKVSWDSYELPQRNRLRLVKERLSKKKKEQDNKVDEEWELKKLKEQGFTSYNGAIKDFSRYRNSAALFHSYEGHSAGVLSVRLSSDYNYIVSCGDDHTVRLWDLHTHKCVRVFEGHDKGVFDVDILATFTKTNPMGGRIVSGSADKTLRLWDAVYGNCLKVIRGHTEVIYACCFTPDGSRIASSSADRTTRLWDSEEGHLIYIFRGHSSSVLSCAFSSTGKYLMTSSDFGERAIKLWYTDMPHMLEKQQVGFRILWETTGLMRRIVMKYDPLPGFFTDKASAKREMEVEDEEDESWDRLHPADAVEFEDDEAAQELKRMKEEEKAALELKDKAEGEGFSISVNSEDRFGRTSQVNSYYAGVELSVVLRGVDPFSQFFVSAYHKRAQFEIFDEKSGARVGSFKPISKAVVGARLCCGGKAVGSNRTGLSPSLTELRLTWRAPTLLERASAPKDQVVGGTIVFKASMCRDPSTLRADEVNPGMVQVSYTLNEVDTPKKGVTLSEISQKIQKEEKVYKCDIVANHQLFIDFARNKDAYSAATLLGERIRLYLEGREIVGQEKVMEVLEALMISDDVEVVIKDAKLLTNGFTTNALDRDKSKDVKLKTPEKINKQKSNSGGGGVDKIEEDSPDLNDGGDTVDTKGSNSSTMKKSTQKKKKKTKEKNKESIKNAASPEIRVVESSDSEGEEATMDQFGDLTRKAKKRALIAKAPPGPAQWSNGPPELDVKKSELLYVVNKRDLMKHPDNMLKKEEARSGGILSKIPFTLKASKGTTQNTDSIGKEENSLEKTSSANIKKSQKSSSLTTRSRIIEQHRNAALSIRKKAEEEVVMVLEMRKAQLSVSEEVRSVALFSSKQKPSRLGLHPKEDPELIAAGKFGMGEDHYRMPLPTIYPHTAISSNSAQVSNKLARTAANRAKEEIARKASKIMDPNPSPKEVERMVRDVMERMMAAEKMKKLSTINDRRRDARERLPGFEHVDEFGDHHHVRAYELNEPWKMSAEELKGVARVMRAQKGNLSGLLVRAFTNGVKSKQKMLPSSSYNKRSTGDSKSFNMGSSTMGSGKQSSSGSTMISMSPTKSFKPNDEAVTEYDKTKRRHMFPTIPGAGTLDKPFNINEEEVQILNLARDQKRGGLVRTFFIEAFGKRHERCHHNSINQVVMSLDERRVASASSDTTIRLWDTKSGTLVSTLFGHEQGVHTVAFSDEGQLLVSSGLDNYIILWNASTGSPLNKFYGHDDIVRRLFFFNDSTAIVSCAGDSTVKVWYLTPQAPAAPDKPVIESATTTSMMVTWIAPPAFNEEIIAFHLERRIGIREEFGNRLTCPGNDHCRDVLDLIPATPYQFRIRAVNRMGEGRWSEPSAQYVTKVDVPEPLDKPEVVNVTPTAVGITWKALTANTKGASISHFVIQIAGAGISFEDKVQKVVSWPNSRDAFVRFKEENEKRIKAGGQIGELSQLGESLFGNADPIRIAKEKRAISQKKMLERERKKKEQEELAEQRKRWEKGDFSKTKKQLKQEAAQRLIEGNEENSDDDSAERPSDSVGLKLIRSMNKPKDKGMDSLNDLNDGYAKNLVDHYFLFEGLRPGLMYRLRVAGVSTIGLGRWSCATISTNTSPTEPNQPMPPTIDPDFTSKFRLRVKWVSPHENGSSLTGYTVRLCHDGSEVSVTHHVTHLDLEQLDPGMPYTFQVRALNQEGYSPWSEESETVYTLTDLAEPPAAPEWAVSGIEWIDLTLDMPYANGSPIVSFVVQFREINMKSSSHFGGDQILPVELISTEETTLSAVSSDGGGTNELGLVSSSGLKKQQEKGLVRVGVGRCALHVTNLKADHTYDFRVAAINAKGVSEFGKPSRRSRTLKPLQPDRVVHLDPCEVYPNAIVLQWTPPICNGADIESYTIEQVRVARRPDASDKAATSPQEDDEETAALAKSRASVRDKDMFVSHKCEGWDESKRIDDLVTGNTYKFRICAVNSVGASPFSSWTPDILVDEECVGDPFLG